MKNKQKKRALLVLLLIFFGLIPSSIYSQAGPLYPADIKGFNASVFETHFSKADRELNPKEWLIEAEKGITRAIYAWELIACGLYDNPFLFNEAKNKIEEWSGEELERRFSQWLADRFFGKTAEQAVAGFSIMLGETQKEYLWHLDNNGNVLFDEITGDPLVIRPDENREFSQDLRALQAKTNEIISENNKNIDALFAEKYTELLFYIPEELREKFNDIVLERISYTNEYIKREFENIAAREESIFTSMRTRDIWSLRRKSDDNSAKIFTEKLITETEEICSKGIEELSSRIEAASAGAGDLALLGEEWLRMYKEQFERGLKAWEEAEERFFIRRIEWEQESYSLFSEGEEIWMAAFSQMEEERQKWELSTRELLLAGEELFRNISADFEKSIADARHEFETNVAMRIGEGTTKAKALVDMYLICASAAVSAMENVQFWYYQYNNQGSLNPKDPEFNSWLSAEEKKNNSSLLSEIRKSYNLYVSYMEKALDARDRILSDYAELLGTGALKDILSPDASSEDFCLDEYQIALLRAKALVLYWERKTEISEAVNNYAQELSSGRMTESEGLREWEKAKASYNESLSLYETELNRLNVIGEDIQKQQELLYELAQKMQQEEEILNRLNSEYTALFSLSIVNRGDFYLLDLNSKYNYLLEEYKLFLQSGKSALYNSALEYGASWGAAEQKETAQYVLDILINGQDALVPSLSVLMANLPEGQNQEIDLKIRLAAIDLFSDNLEGYLRPFNSSYGGADWYSKAKGIVLAEEEKNILYGEKLKERLYEDYKASLNKLIEKENELGLLLLENPFYENQDEFLSEYLYEYYYCRGLLDIFTEYAFYSSFGRQEYWQDTGKALAELLKNYDISPNEPFLPDASVICGSILQKDGDFIDNASLFLMEFDMCFYMVPEWLDYEIGLWKKSLTEYIASYAFCFDLQSENLAGALAMKIAAVEEEFNAFNRYVSSIEFFDNLLSEEIYSAYEALNRKANLLFYAEQIRQTWEEFCNYENLIKNEKHWRQYLTDEYISDNYGAINPASGSKEGILADIFFIAQYSANRINDAFSAYCGFAPSNTEENAAYYLNLFLYEAAGIQRRINSLNAQYNEISGAGRNYEIHQTSPEDMESQLSLAYKNLAAQENAFSSLRTEYLNEAENFAKLGIIYGEQYDKFKEAYNNADQKRFEYEKQNAIQSWAGTAYLGTDNIDTQNNKEKLARAQTVLAVLSGIYGNEEDRYYGNSEYEAVYAEYKQAFERRLNILETVEIVNTAIAQEYSNNAKVFNEYRKSLYQLGYTDQNYADYLSSEELSGWTLKDIITVDNGRLVFSKDDSMVLSGIDDIKASQLNDFFMNVIYIENERYGISVFEESLRGLSSRMSLYFEDPKKFEQWGLARNYLLLSLINANNNLKFLNNYYSGTGEMNSKSQLGSSFVKDDWHSPNQSLYSVFSGSSLITGAENIFRSAWDNLSDEEKADLEFYVILTLNESANDYINGFSQIYALNAYNQAYNYTYNKYSYANNELNTWWKFLWSWVYIEMRDVNWNTLTRIETVLSKTQTDVNKWINGLNGNLQSIQNYASIYADSCANIELFGGENGNSGVNWNDINAVLLKTEKINANTIAKLKTYWEKMQAENGSLFASVPDALNGLLIWAKNSEEKTKSLLEAIWQRDAQNQKANENIFLAAVDAYMSGKADKEFLLSAAENAYGADSAGWKNHFNNINTVLIDDFSKYLDIDVNFFGEFFILGEEIRSLFEKTMEHRYNAELSAREIEWKLALQDISEKFYEWQDSAVLIIENGRNDWKAGLEKLEESYRQWNKIFLSEYSRVSDEWSYAYLASLEDKEQWLQQAERAANQASAESLLSLVGTEAERLSRFMDTREPFNIRSAMPDVEGIMSELLASSGIINAYGAFSAINSSAGSPLPLKRGLGTIQTWDSSLAKTAAADMARQINSDLAESESKKLAYNVRLSADEAVKNLSVMVDLANANFRESMDYTFIMNGLWRKTGNNYVKEIIKGSALLAPVITQQVTVAAYKDYKMEPVSLKTNLEDGFIEGLDTIAIYGLIDNLFVEIEMITAEIFGIGKPSITITKDYFENREQSPGKFGAHIGYKPAVKQEKDIDKAKNIIFNILMINDDLFTGKKSMFHDEGAGELGRLLTEFIYWGTIDSKGSAELALAPWEKKIWNDEGHLLAAPSLRLGGDIAATIVTNVVFKGSPVANIILNAANSLIFGTLDTAFGYKTIDEAGFDFVKSVGINIASCYVPGLIKTVGESANAFVNVVNNTVNKGLQTLATGIITSAINGITYSSENGFGYSSEMFFGGLKNSLINTASSMAGTFTTQSLNAINIGSNGIKVDGYKPTVIKNIASLNSFVGSLAAQGVNYALGGDFTLNILNLSMFTKNPDVNTGLLELKIGRDGIRMNFGTGGANASIDNLIAAMNGAMAWGTNIAINNYVNNNDSSYSAYDLRVLYGNGEAAERGLLWEILSGHTEIIKEAAVAIEETGLSEFKLGMNMKYKDILASFLGQEEDASDMQEDDINTMDTNAINGDDTGNIESGITVPPAQEKKPSGHQPFFRRAEYEDQNQQSPAEIFIENAISNIINTLKSMYNGQDQDGLSQDELDNFIMNLNNFMSVPGGNSWDFYNSIMNEEIAYLNTEEVKGYLTCNEFFQNALLNSGPEGIELWNLVFKGLENLNANELFDAFQNNPYLEQIPVIDIYNLRYIQDMVDAGTFVFVVSQNFDYGGHIAFIGHSDMTYYSPYGTTAYEGKNLADMPAYHLTVVQGGSFPGVNSIVYATINWNNHEKRFEQINNSMIFYTVRRN